MATVRTPQGEDRFDKPIGSILDDQGDSPESKTQVSPIRLRSLRALILDKMAVGDDAAVRSLSEKFRAAFAVFSRGMTPEQAAKALNEGA